MKWSFEATAVYVSQQWSYKRGRCRKHWVKLRVMLRRETERKPNFENRIKE